MNGINNPIIDDNDPINKLLSPDEAQKLINGLLGLDNQDFSEDSEKVSEIRAFTNEELEDLFKD